MAANSKRKRRSGKSTTAQLKPYPDFPLSCNSRGYWQKKINGKVYTFGHWGKMVKGKIVPLPDGGGWQEALKLYNAQRDDLYAGRKPRVKENPEGTTIQELCNRFLTAKMRKMQAGKLSARMLADYKETCVLLAAQLGKERLADDVASDDFEQLLALAAERWGPVRQGNFVTRVKSVFRYGYESGILHVDPAKRYGPEFKKPDRSVMRRHRQKNGKRMFAADEIRTLLTVATPTMKAMILLGVNAGLGNHDVATLTENRVDLVAGWLDFPRPKTGIDRRAKLWPETCEAIRQSLVERPECRQDGAEQLVFLTARGRQFLSSGIAHPVTHCFGDLLRATRLHRKGAGFYWLRHTFQTIGDGAKDAIAVKVVMGHADHSISAVYREVIDDERLVAVAEHVRQWLFGNDAAPERTAQPDDTADVVPPDTGDGEAAALRLFVG